MAEPFGTRATENPATGEFVIDGLRPGQYLIRAAGGGPLSVRRNDSRSSGGDEQQCDFEKIQERNQ